MYSEEKSDRIKLRLRVVQASCDHISAPVREVAFITWSSLILMGGEAFFYPSQGGGQRIFLHHSGGGQSIFFALVKG